jgi:hypothetical protein
MKELFKSGKSKTKRCSEEKENPVMKLYNLLKKNS